MAGEQVASGSGPVGPAVRVRRRRRAAGGRCAGRFDVKVTAAERERLVGLAAGRGVSVPRLLVESALSQGAAASPVAAPRAHPAVVGELLAISRLLGRVGVNVNQIARATNATGAVQPGAEAALEAVARVAGRLESMLGRLDPTGPGERKAPATRAGS